MQPQESAGEFVAPSTPDFAALIAGADVDLSPARVAAVVALLDEGSTVPFIARYRKEATGGADDLAVQTIRDRLAQHRELFERKCTILESIQAQGKLGAELRAQIERASTRSTLEDLYLPYRPKRRTRATIARERGLEPLAQRMFEQRDTTGTAEDIAAGFVEHDEVADAQAALQGARDILAEQVAETAEWRAEIRDLTFRHGEVIVSAARGKSDADSKFRDYVGHREPVARIPSHRFLAIVRGEKEGFLSVKIQPQPGPERAKEILRRRILAPRPSIWVGQLEQVADDAYDRLLAPQITTDIRVELKLRSDDAAIDVFAANLRDLLMAAPFGSRPVIAIDPGLRTGCKVVVLDGTGKLLEHGLVHPTDPRRDVTGTERALDQWMRKHAGISAVAVGNGTGGRETFAVVREWNRKRGHALQLVLVNESGASVYSASEVAREELPDHDVTVRGAVSIGRRLQDPLAELVKIDPKSIGVGQYQHDVDQRGLKRKLDDVVVACVNQVGVDLNTASPSLLGYVAGLGPRLAQNVVKHRDAHGAFTSRQQVLKVAGLGAKTFEQAAGFLRVKGKNPLDDSAVHPERYALVERIAKDLNKDVASLIGDAHAVRRIPVDRYVDESVGRYTLDDIVQELLRPGRDPRDQFEAVAFRDDVTEMEHLRPDMILQGVVTNVTHFGAFVDVGVHQDGLVHVSQIANRYVADPSEELHAGQTVRVRVLEVDLQRRRIALSIKQAK